MTSKAEFTQQWADKSPEERRARLNELASRYNRLDDDAVREHDALATVVAEDEDIARQDVPG